MSTWTRLRRGLAALAAIAFAALAFAVLALANSSAAQAETERGLPSDPSAQGYIGLCNENGQNVVGGSINTRPFVWKAISSSRPPIAYQGQGQNADLVIYQPRPDTGPAYWSGAALTAAGYYDSAKVPTVQATYGDLSLHDMINEYPPQVDGLYVLRIHYGKADYGLYNLTYPIAVIQVTGQTWRLVQGGTVNCAAGHATSNEQLTGVAGKQQTTARAPSNQEQTVSSHRDRPITGPTSKLGSGHRSTVAPGTASTPAGSSSSGPNGSGTNGASGTLRSTGTETSSRPQAADQASTSGTSWVLWLLIAIVVVLAVALVVVFRTRRPHPSGPDG